MCELLSDDVFTDMTPACCQSRVDTGECVCTDHEAVIRAYIRGGVNRPMTDVERDWCVNEADTAGEGYYDVSDLKSMSDSKLAEAVLNAWNMYIRSMF